MEKLLVGEDLTKGFKGLVGHFQKAAAFHRAAGDSHETMAKAHHAQAEVHKARHDELDESDLLKATFGKSHSFHKAMASHHEGHAALHKAHATECQDMADAYDVGDKVVKTATPDEGKSISAPPKVVAANADIDNFLKTSLIDTMTEVGKDGDFKTMLKSWLKDQVRDMLKGVVVPDQVHGALPNNPTYKIVPRDSDSASPLSKEPTTDEEAISSLDPRLRQLVSR
jgi:hypothetical protein